MHSKLRHLEKYHNNEHPFSDYTASFHITFCYFSYALYPLPKLTYFFDGPYQLIVKKISLKYKFGLSISNHLKLLFIKRQRVVHRGTTNDYESQRVLQRVTTSDHEWQQFRVNESKQKRVILGFKIKWKSHQAPEGFHSRFYVTYNYYIISNIEYL